MNLKHMSMMVSSVQKPSASVTFGDQKILKS